MERKSRTRFLVNGNLVLTFWPDISAEDVEYIAYTLSAEGWEVGEDYFLLRDNDNKLYGVRLSAELRNSEDSDIFRGYEGPNHMENILPNVSEAPDYEPDLQKADVPEMPRRKFKLSNHLTHPQNINHVYELVKKSKNAKDLHEKVHYLEVVRETIDRYPALVGRGIKMYVCRALSALNPRSSRPEEEYNNDIDEALRILKTRIAGYDDKKTLNKVARIAIIKCRQEGRTEAESFQIASEAVRKAYNLGIEDMTTQILSTIYSELKAKTTLRLSNRRSTDGR